MWIYGIIERLRQWNRFLRWFRVDSFVFRTNGGRKVRKWCANLWYGLQFAVQIYAREFMLDDVSDIWVIKTVQLTSQLMLIYGSFCVAENKLACDLFNKTANLSEIDRTSGGTLLQFNTQPSVNLKILSKSTSICQSRVDFELPQHRSKVYLLKNFSINPLNHRNCENTGVIKTVALLMRLESERQ